MKAAKNKKQNRQNMINYGILKLIFSFNTLNWDWSFGFP